MLRVAYYSDHIDYDANSISVLASKVPIKRYDAQDSHVNCETLYVVKKILLANKQVVELPEDVLF